MLLELLLDTTGILAKTLLVPLGGLQLAVLLVRKQLELVSARVLIPWYEARLRQDLCERSVSMRAAVCSCRLCALDLARGPGSLYTGSFGPIMRSLGQIGPLLLRVMLIQALPLVEATLIYLVDLARIY